MSWDGQAYHFTIKTRRNTQEESFQLLVGYENGDDWRRLYPSVADASPWIPHETYGPAGNDHGVGQNWTIGRAKEDQGPPGQLYDISCRLGSDQRFTVDWAKVVRSEGTVADPCDTCPPLGECYIVGTWDNFKTPHKMRWDGQDYRYTIELQRSSKEEGFQILAGDTSWKKVVYPSIKDASPWVKHKTMGPDSGGHGKNWTIGRDARDCVESGARYDLTLACPESKPLSLTWTKLEAQPAFGDCYVVGTWDGFRERYQMVWNGKERQYSYTLQLRTPKKEESFQILAGVASFSKCLHPSVADASPWVRHAILGPDDKGHSLNWTIGRTAHDRCRSGKSYEIMLKCYPNGRKVVTWRVAN